MSSVLVNESSSNVNRKRSKKRKLRSSNHHSKRDRLGRKKSSKSSKKRKLKKGKSKKKSMKKSKMSSMRMSPLNGGVSNKLMKNKSNKAGKTLNNKDDLPIITEEDNEDGSFSDSYIPTRYDASGFFSYHTWDDKSDTVRPPDEDRVVRTGPSLWHWSWDLSFGLYDDIYDKIQNNHKFTNNKYNKSHSDNCKDKDLFLEETWLNLEGPIASWQPLFAAIIWFIISMNILFPLSMISQNTKYPYHPNNDDINHKDIHITSNYSHFQVGLILFSFEISSWITTPISSFFILRIGPSLMLFIGILLMIISSAAMSFSYMFYNLQFVIYLIIFRILSGIGFNTVRQSSLFLWSCFAKLDMLASGLGFCVGPVFGDLLYVYLGFKVSYIIYSCILFILLLLPLLIIIIFKLLSLQQIGQLEIPSHIKNIRKPRYDLYNIQNNTMRRSTFYNCKSIFLLVWKLEILCNTIIGLTALEPTLPIYALDPSLDITVSGALFTFIYLPLLALSSLIGLIYAKSSSKFLNSPKKHVKFTRRGMKYITKTLSINLSGMGQSKSQQHNNNKRFNVSKSEKIKLVEKPSWLVKKKRLLPSPDISQHHIIIALGLALNCIGFNILSGTNNNTFMTNSNGIDLILGLVLISIGSSFIIISCIDSFINGLLLNNINQTELTYICINISILCGPLLGGIMLDLANNNFVNLAKYWSIIQTIHLVIYVLILIVKYVVKIIKHFMLFRQKQKQNKALNKSLIENQNSINNNSDNNVMPFIRDLSFGKIQPSMHSNIVNDNENNMNSIQNVNTTTTKVKKKKNNEININMLNDDFNISQLKQRIKPKHKHKHKYNHPNSKNSNSNSNMNMAYVYGTDLRHLCWWKRGLNVRFPYIQWMESGWSSTNYSVHKNKKSSNNHYDDSSDDSDAYESDNSD